MHNLFLFAPPKPARSQQDHDSFGWALLAWKRRLWMCFWCTAELCVEDRTYGDKQETSPALLILWAACCQIEIYSLKWWTSHSFLWSINILPTFYIKELKKKKSHQAVAKKQQFDNILIQHLKHSRKENTAAGASNVSGKHGVSILVFFFFCGKSITLIWVKAKQWMLVMH